jgi:glucokinase
MQGPPASRPRVVGVDVGGTKVCVAALDGTILSEPAIAPTDTSSTAALIDQLEAAIRAHGPYDAVGVAVPGAVEHATGTARYAVNVPLRDVPLRRLLTERLRLPVVVENDATAAALAEAYDDELRLLAAVVVMVTVGTGVGGGIVLDGRPFRGATGAAGEFGQMLVAAELSDGGPRSSDTVPRADSLERLASGRALERLAGERRLPGGPPLVTRAREGDPDARDALRILGERLGVGIANLISAFDPDLVVIGGGVSVAGELLLTPARDAVRDLLPPGVGTDTRIELARHGSRAGVRGAALAAQQALAALES